VSTDRPAPPSSAPAPSQPIKHKHREAIAARIQLLLILIARIQLLLQYIAATDGGKKLERGVITTASPPSNQVRANQTTPAARDGCLEDLATHPTSPTKTHPTPARHTNLIPTSQLTGDVHMTTSGSRTWPLRHHGVSHARPMHPLRGKEGGGG
jgi:hypothetical protein